MSRKKDANKYWIYGEDAALAAQFTAYLATVLKNRRLTYIRHLKKIQKVECSYEYAAETIEHVDSIREESLESAVEAKLMWEAIKPYLHKLSPKECEVMICLYIDRLSIADTATKLKIKPDTVSTHKHNAEILLDVIAGVNGVSAQTGEVFHNDAVDVTGLNIREHLIVWRTLFALHQCSGIGFVLQDTVPGGAKSRMNQTA